MHPLSAGKIFAEKFNGNAHGSVIEKLHYEG